MASAARISPSDAIEFNSIFRLYSSRVAELGAKLGVKITPYRNPELPAFSMQSLDAKQRIIDDLSIYLKICEQTLSMGQDLSDPVTLTWNAIKQFGFRPTSDLFSYVTKDSVVEIHDPMGIQIFRNFEFYHYCSYSLEELYCYPWEKLYKRDEKIVSEILKIAASIYSGAIKSTVATNLPAHIIQEVYSPLKYQISAEVNFISPLFDEISRPTATVAIESGKLASKLLSPVEEQQMLDQYYMSQDANLLDLN